MKPDKSFFEMIDSLKHSLEKNDDVAVVLKDIGWLLRDSDVRREFFKMINGNSDWLSPINKAGYFDAPPNAVRTKGLSTQHPLWPESSYLVDIVPDCSSEVAEIFSKFKTDNASILSDIIKAGMKMQVKDASTLVQAICYSIKAGALWFNFEDACRLCARLAEGNEEDIALDLANILFTPTFEKGQDSLSHRDEYWYKKGLEKILPIFVKVRPKEFLSMLSGWLKLAVEAKKYIDRETGDDNSYMWRPAIEEHSQNQDYDFACNLVGFLREGLEMAVRERLLSLEDVIGVIREYKYVVFKRIKIHLITEFSDLDPDSARRNILDESLFEDHRYKHEYAMLIGRRLELLETEERALWFGWIDKGPDLDDYGIDPDDDSCQNRIDYWKFEKLYLVRDHLEGERREFFEKMYAKRGVPELADLNIRIGPTRWGPESPTTNEEFQSLSLVKVVEKVTSWKEDSSSFMGPSIDGINFTFKQYIAENPAAHSSQAGVMKGKPAIYVRAFLTKMKEAIREDIEIDLHSVLKLCQWVISRPLEEHTGPVADRDGTVDKDWQWTRDEISEFLKNVCKAERDKMPIYPLDDFRQPIWKLIYSLCKDSSVSYDIRDSQKDDPRVRDYLDQAINSPRGKAVEAALEFARWIAQHIKESDGKNDVVLGGLKSIPELHELLELQLDAENRTFEAMAILGSRVGLLYWIDKDWLAENANNLFQLKVIESDPSKAYGWAAWNAFLVWVHPHIAYYKIFKQQFAYTVKQAAIVKPTSEDSLRQPMKRLGEHLVLLHGRGDLGMDDDDGIVRRFLQSSKSDIRTHAIDFIGRSLRVEKNVPERIIKRFMELWEVYWTSVGREDARTKSGKWLFGDWFSSGAFPEEWALEQLEQFVEIVPIPQPDYKVIEQLANVAKADRGRAVRILYRMVHGGREAWHLHEWKSSVKQILSLAMEESGNTKELTVELINDLGRQGFIELGDLLKK